MRLNRLSYECRIWLAVTAIAAVAGSTLPVANAQSSESASEKPAAVSSAWVVNCSASSTADGDLACRMVQNLVVAETKQRLLSAVIHTPAGSETPIMTLALPHGLDSTTGVSASVDDKDPFSVVLKTSDQQGAYATAALDEELLENLKAGKEMKVSFQSASRQAFNVGVSLAGFSAAFRKLTAN